MQQLPEGGAAEQQYRTALVEAVRQQRQESAEKPRRPLVQREQVEEDGNGQPVLVHAGGKLDPSLMLAFGSVFCGAVGGLKAGATAAAAGTGAGGEPAEGVQEHCLRMLQVRLCCAALHCAVCCVMLCSGLCWAAGMGCLVQQSFAPITASHSVPCRGKGYVTVDAHSPQHPPRLHPPCPTPFPYPPLALLTHRRGALSCCKGSQPTCFRTCRFCGPTRRPRATRRQLPGSCSSWSTTDR